MTYKIFLSHASADDLIAQEVSRVINNAFEGHIEIYLASREISGGEVWKQKIREELARCDAIMSIVTDDSIAQPWLYVEWSAFWLHDKKYYVLLADDFRVQDLFQPMQERQVTKLSDEASVRRLFRALNESSDHAAIPYTYVQELIDSVRDALVTKNQDKLEQSYARFRDKARALPVEDKEKEQIATFFLRNGEQDHFIRVCREIRDDSIKASFIYSLLRERKITHTAAIVEMIKDAEKLSGVAQEMIDLGFSDSSEFRGLIETLAEMDQTELRKILIHMVDRSEENTELFRYLVSRMTNMAELRKVPERLVRQKRISGQALLDIGRIMGRNNRAELRKLTLEFIANGLEREPTFMKLVQELAIGNQREMEKVMVELYRQDKDLFQNLLGAGLITDELVLTRLQELMHD